MSDLPPNVRPVKDRHGKTRYRFRRKGWKSHYLPGDPGSAEFHETYAEILKAGPTATETPKPERVVTPKSLDDLLARMKRSPGWKEKAARTQHVQSRVYQRFMDRVDSKGRRYGERPVATVTVGWLDRILGDMSETPGAANDLRKKVTVLLEYGCKLEWIGSNPARHTIKFKAGEGFHTWTEKDIAKYRGTHALGTMARLAFELALNTAARRCNVATLTRDDIQDGWIVTDHAKGNEQATVPMLASTRAALESLPAAPIKHLVTTEFGKPFSVGGLGNRMRKWCDAADLPHCSIHGLRKAMSRRLAETGATDAEGMAVTGHKKAATFQKYREKANRKAMANRAVSNLEPLDVVQPE